MTTNKDIYAADENAIIVGVIPVYAPEGHAVDIRVVGPGGHCTTQTILPAADNPFRSKPITLHKCGLGEFYRHDL